MSKKRKPTKQQIERVADAIKLLVPLYGADVRLNELGVVGWTEIGIANTKWPKSFAKDERKVIRLIAKTAIENFT